MTKAFEEKVKRNLTVDTRSYRYNWVEDVSKGEYRIERCRIDLLGTTAAIDGWEIVKTIKFDGVC